MDSDGLTPVKIKNCFRIFNSDMKAKKNVVLYQTLLVSLRLRANGHNNSQHCCANNVGSCCMRVGSGVQTDATTPKNVGTCSASWEGYNP